MENVSRLWQLKHQCYTRFLLYTQELLLHYVTLHSFITHMNYTALRVWTLLNNTHAVQEL
jgi:hypothetical protein